MATKKNSDASTQVRIGISDSQQELNFETPISHEEVAAAVSAALSSGTPLSLTDSKERTIMIPAGKIAFVELGATPDRKVGFATI
jgi:Protein of unknown function (DUF3107)